MHLRETLNTEWVAAQGRIAIDEKHLKELRAEINQRQHITAG